MSRATGADLPLEMLSSILNCLLPDLGTDRKYSLRAQNVKRGVVAPSLVCKHWAKAIRPILFRQLILRNAEDVQFLKNIVYSPHFTTSSLSGAIKFIHIYYEAAKGKPWFHHVHGLSTRLRGATFQCIVTSRAQDPGSTVAAWIPFKSIPRVTPSYVRLSALALQNLTLTNTTELARLVDSLSTLERCDCNGLTFLDPSPVVQSRRFGARRRASSALSSFEIKHPKNTAVSLQAVLAADILEPGRRMGLDDRTWDAAFQLALALKESEVAGVTLKRGNGDMFDMATISCSSGRYSYLAFGRNSINVDIKVCRPNADQGAGSPLAHIESITLRLSSSDLEVANTLPWDGLRPVVDSPHMHRLCIADGMLPHQSYEATKRILCSVLRRTQLTWALESRKLQFSNFDHSITSEDILSVPTEHTIDGTTITLDIAEQAEWLLPASRPGLSDIDATRNQYLRRLVATRTSRASIVTDTSSGIARSTADSTQHTVALEQAAEVPEADVQGSEAYEGGGSGGGNGKVGPWTKDEHGRWALAEHAVGRASGLWDMDELRA
ncbi:uncharacterized protein PHACADRAFT_260229, partial [Phanerochaete carnosa HHB-10118-sp]